MPIYHKEAFDVSRDFDKTWETFMAMKPEAVGKAEWIREAITYFVEKNSPKAKKNAKRG